jgi:hypothetical protein
VLDQVPENALQNRNRLTPCRTAIGWCVSTSA